MHETSSSPIKLIGSIVVEGEDTATLACGVESPLLRL